jgi:hypothetical protein
MEYRRRSPAVGYFQPLPKDGSMAKSQVESVFQSSLQIVKILKRYSNQEAESVLMIARELLSLDNATAKVVELTEGGRKFVEETRVALLHVERAVQGGRAASQEAEVVLNIGRSPYTDPFLVTTLLSIKLPLFPQLKIELSQQFSCNLIREVLAGGLDLAIATEPGVLTSCASNTCASVISQM